MSTTSINSTCRHSRPRNLTACPDCTRRATAAEALADMRYNFASVTGADDLLCELLRAAEAALLDENTKAGQIAMDAINAHPTARLALKVAA